MGKPTTSCTTPRPCPSSSLSHMYSYLSVSTPHTRSLRVCGVFPSIKSFMYRQRRCARATQLTVVNLHGDDLHCHVHPASADVPRLRDHLRARAMFYTPQARMDHVCGILPRHHAATTSYAARGGLLVNMPPCRTFPRTVCVCGVISTESLCRVFMAKRHLPGVTVRPRVITVRYMPRTITLKARRRSGYCA